MEKSPKCPICNYDFSVAFTFDEIETKQGGKNENCSSCNWLLWASIEGDITPVPMLLLVPIMQKQRR